MVLDRGLVWSCCELTLPLASEHCRPHAACGAESVVRMHRDDDERDAHNAPGRSACRRVHGVALWFAWAGTDFGAREEERQVNGCASRESREHHHQKA